MGSTPSSGIHFGRYIIKSRMARGGMGEVFRAIAIGSSGFEKPVVIKRILPVHAGRSDLAELFVAEAKIMTRLVHPNIVEVLDFGIGEDGDYYLVLELVNGVDLGRLLKAYAGRQEPFPVPLALFIAAQVLRGLAHAHARSAEEGELIVHRDVSPGNVLLSTVGEVKVADFGVAIAMREADDRSGQRELVGKPSYMAPEQFDGEKVDPRADIFSVGVVLFQMLTNARPFPGGSAAQRMLAAREGRMLRASELCEGATEVIDAILARALAGRREDRFPDARAMARAIESLRDQGQPIATSDDLAEVVTAALREAPEHKPVIRLGPAVAPEEDLEGRELTRTGDAGAFTLRILDPHGDPEAPTRAEGAGLALDEVAGEEVRAPSDRPAPSGRRVASDRPSRGSDRPSRTEVIPAGGEIAPDRPVDSGATTLPRERRAASDPPSSGYDAAFSIRDGAAPESGAPARSTLVSGAAPGDAPARASEIRLPMQGPRPGLLAAVAGAVAIAALAVVALRAARPDDAPAHAELRAAAPAEAAEVAEAEVAPATAPAAAEPRTTPAAAPAPSPARAAIAPAGRAAATAPATAAAPAAAAATATAPATAPAPAPAAAPVPAPAAAAPAPAATCEGDVHLFASHGWVVSGGPAGRVQAPGRYRWPCGSFHLRATSRVDAGQTKQISITVRASGAALVDLR